MANDAEMVSWTDLLLSSSKLLEQAAPSAQFPPLQRNLDQLEVLSKKLKAKTLRTEVPTQSIAATRLPAREGINAGQLARDLKSCELKAWSDTEREREREKMANDTEMGSWTDLLHSSSKLLEQAAPSAQFPPLQRNLDQLEVSSKKLKAKTLRTEAPTQSIAATRLLAREGINAEQLARDLKSFELKVHEMAMVSAIQEAQKDNLRSFNDYTMTVLQAVGARLDQVTADVAELRTSVVTDLTALRVEVQDHARSIRGMLNDLFRVIDGRLPRRLDQLDDTPAWVSPSQPRDA